VVPVNKGRPPHSGARESKRADYGRLGGKSKGKGSVQSGRHAMFSHERKRAFKRAQVCRSTECGIRGNDDI